jgi:hypothetical protein
LAGEPEKKEGANPAKALLKGLSQSEQNKQQQQHLSIASTGRAKVAENVLHVDLDDVEGEVDQSLATILSVQFKAQGEDI